MDGHNARFHSGVGIIIDVASGLVLTDRHTVPIPLVNIMCVFAGKMTVAAKVVYLHPLLNLVWLVFDVSKVRHLGLQGIRMAEFPPIVGDLVYYATLNTLTHIPSVRTTRVKVPYDKNSLPFSRISFLKKYIGSI